MDSIATSHIVCSGFMVSHYLLIFQKVLVCLVMILPKVHDYMIVFLERSDREGSRGGGGGGEILEMLEQNEDIQDDYIHLTQAVTLTTDI